MILCQLLVRKSISLPWWSMEGLFYYLIRNYPTSRDILWINTRILNKDLTDYSLSSEIQFPGILVKVSASLKLQDISSFKIKYNHWVDSHSSTIRAAETTNLFCKLNNHRTCSVFSSHKSLICHRLKEKGSFWHLTFDCGKYFSFYHPWKSQLDALTIKCHVSKECQEIIVALSASQIYGIKMNCDILTRYQDWRCIKIISCDLTCSRCHLSSRRRECRNRHP